MSFGITLARHRRAPGTGLLGLGQSEKKQARAKQVLDEGAALRSKLQTAAAGNVSHATQSLIGISLPTAC